MSITKVFMPFLQEEFTILFYQSGNFVQFVRLEASYSFKHNRIKPEFCHEAVSPHMNMRWLSIIQRYKEKTIWPHD